MEIVDQEEELSGSIVSFNGRNNTKIKSLVANIEPVQDLHGYDYPWPAGGGVNKFDEVWESGSFNGNNGTPVPNAAWSRSVNYIPVEPETSYYCNFEGVGSGNGYYLFFYRADNSFISLINKSANSIVTTPADSAKCKLQYKRTIETIGNYKVAVNYPATVTTYSPYKNSCPISGWTCADIYHEVEYDADANPTISINWETEASTVYSGALMLNPDRTGTLVVDMAIIHAKDINFTSNPTALNDGSGYYLYKTNVFSPNNPYTISNLYHVSAKNDAWENRTFGEIQGKTSSFIITVPPEANTLALAKQWINDNDPYFVYQLAEPIIYTLTAEQVSGILTIFYGINNIWSDIGNITVKIAEKGITAFELKPHI